MKVKLVAGAEFDMPNRQEMEEAIRAAQANWMAEVARGTSFRFISAPGTISAAGDLLIGGDATTPESAVDLGPAQGFLWSVLWLGIDNYTPTAETLSLYRETNEAARTIHPAMPVFLGFNPGQLVLKPGQSLVLAGSALVSTGTVWLTGEVREYPQSLAYRI